MKVTTVDVSTGEIAEHEIDDQLIIAPVISRAQFSANVGRAIDAKLDMLARSWQYRDYISARSYVGDVSAKYAAEGAALAAYGSQCWTLMDQLALDVMEGRAETPTSVEAVLAMLPEEPSRPTP